MNEPPVSVGKAEGSTLSESVGTIVNLSESGCCVHTDSQVYTGIQLALRLHVPEEASPIHIEQAAVRWSREREVAVDEDRWLNELVEEAIRDLLKKYEKRK